MTDRNVYYRKTTTVCIICGKKETGREKCAEPGMEPIIKKGFILRCCLKKYYALDKKYYGKDRRLEQNAFMDGYKKGRKELREEILNEINKIRK